MAALIGTEMSWSFATLAQSSHVTLSLVALAAILRSALAGLRPDTPREGRIVRVEPLAERHREGLREAAEREPQIHRYTGMYSLGFDRWFDEAVGSEAEVPFAVIVDGRPAGSTRYLNIEPLHRRMR